ncbi:hypothetical protein GQ54DRAFT_257947 [Martensiomyces pterosporus]|nr:hypothetical protein GQ54DRAFT_257947 [Martensiomyces pterosporus]
MLQTPSKRAQQRMAQKPSYTPPAVVRKDSGEIVRPCLRRRANTEPATCADGTATSSTTSSSSLYPSIRPPRFVHFGAELERVRWFLKGQCPKSVCSDATPDSHAPATVRLTSLRRPTPSFAIFETSPVVLERVELACSKRSSAALRGTVKVHNVAFEKVVVLRYSFDHWRTTEECQATYTKTLADAEGGRPGVDRFSFTLPLAASATVDLPATIAMCVRYDVGGCEHWDNNCGSNYMFKITHPAVPAIADEEADADAVFARAAKSSDNNQLSAHNASAGNAAIAAQPPYMQQQAFSTLPPCSSMQTELPLYQDVAWCGGDFAAYPATAICSSSYSGTFGIDSASMLSAAEYMLAPAGSPLATPMRTGSPISRPVFSPNGSVRTGSPLAWSRNTTASALQC